MGERVPEVLMGRHRRHDPGFSCPLGGKSLVT